MATPLDLRNRRREAQRAVRLALNAANAGLDEWKAAVADGKRHATELSNAVLTQLHLPALPLGLLADVRNLREAAAAKLVQQQEAALTGLAACLEQLHAAVARLEAASAGLQQLLGAEAAAPLLMEGAVFATLPLRVLGSMVGEVLGMYQAELAVKAGVLQGFDQILGGLREAEQQEAAGRSSSGTGQAAAQREDKLRRTMQVYLTAWLLSPEVDDKLVTAHLQLISAEMKGF